MNLVFFWNFSLLLQYRSREIDNWKGDEMEAKQQVREHLRNGEIHQALNALRRVFGVDDVFAHFNRGVCLFALSQNEAAAYNFQKAVELGHNPAREWLRKAELRIGR